MIAQRGSGTTRPLPRLYSVSTLSQVTPRPRSRSFYVAQTGAGKSTLACACAEEYHRLYPRHVLYIIDLKGRGRFYPVERERADSALFPEGLFPRVVAGREAVPIVADEMGKKPRWPAQGDAAMVVHSLAGTHALCDWLYKSSSVERPVMVYFDETLDLMRGDHRAVAPVRRLIQHGRELGVGVMVLNQMPTYIDRTWFTESNQLYVGRLLDPDDREKVLRKARVQGIDEFLEEPLEPFEWLYLDQDNNRAAKFHLGGRAS